MPVGKTDSEATPFEQLKEQFLVVEEKVDGTGVSISLDRHLDLRIEHRGAPAKGKEFKPLKEWADRHWEDFLDMLGERYILFGEWMHHKHTIFYDKLPHLFLESDIYDKQRGKWLSTLQRSKIIGPYGFIKQVPVIAAFKPSTLSQITSCLGKTVFQSEAWQQSLKKRTELVGCNLDKALKETDKSGMMEGLYIKQEDDIQVVNRYKYVRHEFLDTILQSQTHLIDRLPIYNSLEGETFNFQVGE